MKARALMMAAMMVLLPACAGAGTATIELVTPGEAAQVLEREATEVVLLDVRTPEEFTEQHVPGAVNVDYYRADFPTRLDTLAKDVPYVVYCRSGNRSAQAVQIMRDLGFTRVFEVDGGILAWARDGLPLQY